MNSFLETDRFSLVSLTKDHISDQYLSWLNSKEVCSGNSHYRFPYSASQAEKYIEQLESSRNHITLAIIDKKTQVHLGNIALQSIDFINRNAEFAILIGEKDYWGKGVGLEVGSKIIEHAFSALGLIRIYCGTFSNNSGMQQLAEKLGMSKEGERKSAVYKDGEFLDVIEYGLVRETT